MSSSVPCAPSNRTARPDRARVLEEQRDVRDPRPHALPRPRQLVEHLPPVHRRVADDPVAGGDVVLDGLGERGRIREVADAHAAARDLVFVGRADAARRRPDLALPAAGLAQEIQLAVVRQDEVRLVADDEARADRDPGPLDLVDLREERLRIDHHAVADHARNAFVQDPRRQQAQHELPPVGVDRVAGVVAALVPGDDRKIRREQIDDLALSLVSPLRTEHRDVHNCSILPF